MNIPRPHKYDSRRKTPRNNQAGSATKGSPLLAAIIVGVVASLLFTPALGILAGLAVFFLAAA